MKKFLFFAAAVAALLTSCQKEKGSDDSTVKGVKTITASIGNSTKVVMGTDDGTDTKLNWEIGDNLLTINMSDGSTSKYSAENAGETASFSLAEGDGINPEAGHRAVYPYENMHFGQGWFGLKFTFSGNQSYTANSFDKSAMPLLATNGVGETNFTFNAMAPVLRLKVKLETAISDVKVNSVVIESAHKNLAGTSGVASNLGRFREPDPEYGEVSKSITLDCSDEDGVAINNTAATQFCIVLPENEYPSGDLTITIKTNKGDIVKTSKAAATFVAGEVYNINVSGDLPALPAGALPGVFTVSNDNGTTKTLIYFSQGNLYYDGSKFNFEANQYGFNSSYQSTYVSHFYWSKDASVAYANSYNESGTTGSDVFFTNETVTTAKAGFTVNVGGKEQSGWRTISINEWQYLFNTRTVNGGQGEGKSYSLNITYGGKMGLVLYPDYYDKDPVTGTVTDLPVGVVFLPAAGYRSGSDVQIVGVNGFYWTSTAYSGYASYAVGFNSSLVFPPDNIRRDYGYGVRLITDVIQM